MATFILSDYFSTEMTRPAIGEFKKSAKAHFHEVKPTPFLIKIESRPLPVKAAPPKKLPKIQSSNDDDEDVEDINTNYEIALHEILMDHADQYQRTYQQQLLLNEQLFQQILFLLQQQL
jgi:hypothetical protein